ncbi:MAG TPA: hypothetical protein VGK71_00995 [Nitrospirota bacterium]
MAKPISSAAYFIAVLLALSLWAGAAFAESVQTGEPGPGGVEGIITHEDGVPVEGADVYFYTDPDKRFRGPADFMAEPTGADGKFITELPPGKYFAVARKRASGSISGGLQKGDLYSRDPAGPIEVSAGKYARADLKLGVMTGNMLLGVFPGKPGVQGMKGLIIERDGSPKKGAYAFAYKNPRMAGKPDYVSEWTREDGGYVLNIAEQGTYYIGARTGFMGVPKPDEPYGRYDGKRGAAVTVSEGGFVSGVDITLKKFNDIK